MSLRLNNIIRKYSLKPRKHIKFMILQRFAAMLRLLAAAGKDASSSSLQYLS